MSPRCEWVNAKNPLYIAYHDIEWGVPVFDEEALFKMLCLEGQQAGLNWETVLKKRQAYDAEFFKFDIKQVANLSDRAIEDRLQNPKLIRNRLKLGSIRKNAQALRTMHNVGRTLSDLIWERVEYTPVQNAWKSQAEVPTSTELSHDLSQELKRLGFNFVGPTICYALLQAVGVVNDHIVSCFRHQELYINEE